MSSPRLRVQFETLFEKFSGNDTEVQLEDITEALFCTRRNARIVLNKLEEEGGSNGILPQVAENSLNWFLSAIVVMSVKTLHVVT